MTTRDNYLAPYYERATIDQLADEYKQKGYSVQRDARLVKYRIDLLAEKEGQKIYIEVKRKKMDAEARRRIAAIEELICNMPNTKLIVVPERYSEEKKVEFEHIDEILFELFMIDFPDELDELSTHTSVDSVDSVVIDEIKVLGQDIVIKCNGQVNVELQYGSDSEQDDEPLPSISFPFEFEGTVSWDDGEYRVTEVDNLRINTDDFYR